MEWELHKAKLEKEGSVQLRPKGRSMEPRINSGNLVTIKPCPSDEIKKGDMVFCKVKGTYYIHLVQVVEQKMGGFKFQIGNNKNHTNGTVGEDCVFGKVTKVEE